MKTIRRRTFLKMIAAASTAPLLKPLSVLAMQPEASLVLFNGSIITVDGSVSVAEAIAVRGYRILAVGSTPHIKSLKRRFACRRWAARTPRFRNANSVRWRRASLPAWSSGIAIS